MYFQQISILLLAGISTIAATPTPTVQKRWPCQVAIPEYARVEEARPVESYLPGFLIAQDSHHTNRKDAFVQFDIPAGSYGCQLEASFPASYPITSSGNTQVYVYSTDKALTYGKPNQLDASWAYCPAPVSHVGTISFKSETWGVTRSVINSFQCKEKMTYRFKMSTDSEAAGSVQFEQNSGAGLRMVYNC
ncbi:hypothetical protein BJ875DRAFT_250445 [Amylocarpus encephaloides]|uniref:Ubiquitin 3 binding protein But2 C-terminal domain-containing protein n=1 Tax=Amylocarpus encephaloides TaxID=45428 RepID=A0A9P7Y666_9HELO|nr:hypothetical protein BJ875DRAFT_250445 [Amylocarpus encephaloides]